MATGRTVSASFLTDLDKQVIELCEKIAETIQNTIKDKDLQKDFKKQFGKISYTRDGGLGLGGGKLQRDAICVRGRQGKAPFSNRNLRWHPLVVAHEPISFAKEIEKIEIEGSDESQVLVFYIKENGKLKPYPADKVHELPERYVALPKHWQPHVEILKNWNDTLWTQNSCVIPALECCDWQDSLETYAVLGIAVAVDFYGVDFQQIYKQIISILQSQTIQKSISLPTKLFPTQKSEFVSCPVCLCPIFSQPANFAERERHPTWQPAWRPSKKGEGEDASVQVMHVNPLIDKEIRHNAKNVRYGHRWCNVAMTDHSLDETLDFMEFIVKAHNRI